MTAAPGDAGRPAPAGSGAGETAWPDTIRRRRLAALADPFLRAVDAGELPGIVLVVSLAGEEVLRVAHGWRDLERDLPMTHDTVVRIYSMSKAVTSAVVLSLVDDGRLGLDDAVADYLPSVGNAPVLAAPGSDGEMASRPARTVMRVRHLLAHTSGHVSGFADADPVDAAYRQAHLQVPRDFDGDLAGWASRLAAIPLAFDPGTSWRYGVSSDVAGRLAEIVAGKPLADLVSERVTAPLGMTSTGFAVQPKDANRFAACYGPRADGGLALLDDPSTSTFLDEPRLRAGGSGLVSCAEDFHRFCLALLGGGELDGTRILSRASTDALMTNQLPNGTDLAGLGVAEYHGTPGSGIGFACGGAVVLGAAAGPVGVGARATIGAPLDDDHRPSPGTYFWGGIATTEFLVDRQRQLVALLLTQLSPSFARPTRTQLWSLLAEI